MGTSTTILGQSITECSVCLQPLPTLLLQASPDAQLWECLGCGATYQGKLANRVPLELKARLKPAAYFSSTSSDSMADSALVEFAEELVARDKEMLERRGAPRRPIMLPIQVLPLDEDLFPAGPAFCVVSRDISTTGLAILHHSPIVGNIAIKVTLPDQGDLQFTVRTSRNKPVGPFYEVGGEFISRVC